MKIKEFQKDLAKKSINCTIFINSSYNNTDPNINYFTGMSAEWCCMVVPSSNKGSPFFIVPRMELEKARKISRIKKIIPLKKDVTLASILSNNIKNLKTIGINKQALTLVNLDSLKKGFCRLKKKIRFIDISNSIKSVRAIKCPEEIKNIRRACGLTDKIFSAIIQNFRNFRTEKNIVRFIELKAFQLGARLSFPPIIASGKNASMPHYTPKDKKLQKGFCIIDFGVKYKGYCADITRTVYIGNPKIEEIRTYQTLLSCQERAIMLCRPGKRANTLFSESEELLEKYKKYFLHGLGHGIGVEIHESPSLKPNSRDILKEGMVFTIEPGIYVANKFGVRIEDDVLLTKKGPEVLTKSTKSLILIKYPSFNR